MAGVNDNLIPFSERSVSEAREFGAKGGVNSGIARRKKKAAREAAQLFLSLKAPPEMASKLLEMGVDPDDADMQMAIIAGLAMQATAGNHNAAKLLFELSESGQTEETESSGLVEVLTADSGTFEDGDDSGIIDAEGSSE